MQQVKDFLHLLTGEQNPKVHWQTFYDPKDGQIRPDLAKNFYATLDESMDFLNYAQSQNAGVYLCINDTDGTGRETGNITKLRTLFADYDGVAEPDWPIPPSFKTQRDATHGHAYWLINPDEWEEEEEWTLAQRRIAIVCGTDLQVIDPARVARCVEFLHLKNPSNPQRYSLVEGGSRKTYSKSELLGAFRLTPEQETAFNAWVEGRKGIQTGQGYTNNPVYIEKSVRWLKERANPAILGDGTRTLYASVAYLHDHGISLDKAKELAWEHYNPRCEPPWGDHERDHFEAVIERAYKYSVSAAGCKTATAEFGRITPVPEPVDGWEVNSSINDEPRIEVTSNPLENRINRDEAVILQSQLTAKSSHYELARCFDGAVFDGIELVRCDKTFYAYNGKSWTEVSDEVIKAKVQRYYAAYSPPEALTKGIFNCLCDLVNVPVFQNKTWMNERHSDPKHTVCFNNCLVDFSGDQPQVFDHTPEFINFTVLPHDYNPGAQCPRFMAFLNEIWPDDKALHWQLIEWMGYLLIGGNDMQKMAILHGKSRAGKGVITKVCTALVGDDNTVSTDLEEITENSTLHSMYKSALTYLPDQHDVQFSKRSRVLSKLKAVTGNDKIGWHVIYKGHQSGVISSKLMMTTNNIPTFNDPSGAMVNRMLLFPFYVSFKGREDFDLERKLMSEMEGITNLAIQGLVRLKNNGRFTESEAALEEKQELQDDMFSLSGFISEYCNLGSHMQVCTRQIYKAYRVWAMANGVKSPLEHRRFITEMKNSQHNISKKRSRIGDKVEYVLCGIELNQDFKFDNVTELKHVSQ